MKFELTRKLLVGFVCLAMVFGLFSLPISAQEEPEQGPIVNAGTWTVTVTPTSGLNPADTDPADTHTITIYTKLDGALADPDPTTDATVCVAVAFGDPLVVTSSGLAAVWVSTGVYTYTFTYDIAPIDLGPGTYTIYGYISDNGAGIDPADTISDPVTKTWAERVATTVVIDPEEAENDLEETHTFTVYVYDQFDEPFDPADISAEVTGFNEGAEVSILYDETGVYTGSYDSDEPAYPDDASPFVDIITVYADDATGTATKTWTYTPEFYEATPTPTEAYNMVGEEHTVTVNFYDQYGYPIPVDAALDWEVSGANTATGSVEGEDVESLSFSYTGENAGMDKILITGTVNGEELSEPLEVTKYWAYEWDVEPDAAVNALGAEHTFTVYGAPGDRFTYVFSSAGAFDIEDLLLYIPYTGSWVKANSMPLWLGEIGPDGTATITVMAQRPGKFFLDVTFYLQEFFGDSGLVTGSLQDQIIEDPFGRTEPVTIKVSKAYAQLTGFDITSDDINPITQVATWDVHTVYATALGEFPVKPSLVIPSNPPPEGGEYVLDNGILWVKDAPVGGVNVDWEVLWDYCADGVTVDVFADRILDEAYLDGGETDSFHQDGDPLTVTHWLHASSVTDGTGTAYLTYHMEYWGKGESSTCTYHFQCLADHITVTGGYGVPTLDEEYGTITETAEKEWRDYGFKVYKYHDNTQDPNNYIGGAKFYLRRLDLPGTPTYVPPMPADHPWVTGGYTEAVEDPDGPGNAALVDPADPPGVVTTFSTGPEKGAAIWYHLPYGTYGLFEYSVPAPWAPLEGCLDIITIDQDQPVYWCASPTKIITHYLENTISPTQVYFYKLNDCWSVLPGAVFQATNLDTSEVFGPFTSDGFGKVVLEDLTFDPVLGTWYMVEEIEAPEGFFPVVPFYFYLDKTGMWDDHFYDGIYGSEVYPRVAHPENGVIQHWVKDPSQGTPPVTPVTVTFNLVQGWNMVTPGVISDKTAKVIFGTNFVHAYHWDPLIPGPDGSLGGWLFCDNQTLVPGWGYWVRMSGPATVTLSGAPVSSPVTMEINRPWEQIGNPFATDLPVANVKIVKEGVEKSLADAKAAGWIYNAYSWNGTSYDTLDYSTGTLPAGKGFWLRVLVDDLSIKYTK